MNALLRWRTKLLWRWQARVLPVLPLPFIPVQYRWHFDHIALRLLSLDLGGRQIGNALAQQDFNGADLADGQFGLEQTQRMVLTAMNGTGKPAVHPKGRPAKLPSGLSALLLRRHNNQRLCWGQ
jgi:hypothetical protein